MSKLALLAGMFMMVVSVPSAAADSSSADAAKRITALLDQRKLDSVAAPIPDETNQFVAALYYPNGQLLVVSTRYDVPSLLKEKIWSQKYRDVYTALHGGGAREGKFFVIDMGANGLPVMKIEGAQADTIYEDASKQTIFNGDWKSQKLSEKEYTTRLEAADDRYSKLLAALIATLESVPSK